MKKLSYMKKIFIYLFLLIIAFAITVNTKVKALTQTIDMIWAQPGEDASTEVIVAWHSNLATGSVYITLDSDTNFESAEIFDATGVYDNTAYAYDKVSFYKFEVKIPDLIPNTKYRYRIKYGTLTSKAYTFKTAGNSGSFNFLWIGDYHTYKVDSCQTRYTYVNSIVSNLNKANKNFDFVMSTGDNVSYGGSYDNYQVMNGYINLFKTGTLFASVTGNHDYYGSHNEYPSSSVNIDNRFFEAVFAHPDNGIGNPLDSSYWFIYNSIMFIMLDSLAASYSHTLADQKLWMEKVVNENEGKFQYLIVAQHYPWMNALTGEHSGPYTSNFNQWYQVFDKCGVDLAIAGDHHVYYRSKTIYDNQIVSDDDKGTVYVGCPQIGDRYRTITDRKDPEYYAIRIDDTADDPNKLANYSGCTFFSVTPSGIKGELVDTNGDVKDTYTIKSKRQVNWESKKNLVQDTFVASTNGTKTFIDFAPNYSEYIQKIRVMNGSDLVTSVFPSKYNTSTIELTGLTQNTVYNYKIIIDFVDGTSKQFDYTFTTYGDFGTFDSFKASISGNNLVLSWNQDLKNDVIKNYDISKDGTKLATIASTSTSYEISAKDTNLSTVYKLDAKAANGDIIFTKYITYSLYGDDNYDGQITKDDVSSMFKKIQSGYVYKDTEFALLDLNVDGKVDIGDAILIYEYANKEIEDLTGTQVFLVSIINKNGDVISTQKVKYGDNAILPIINDADFLYYTNDGVYVTGDMIIRPVYR